MTDFTKILCTLNIIRGHLVVVPAKQSTTPSFYSLSVRLLHFAFASATCFPWNTHFCTVCLFVAHTQLIELFQMTPSSMAFILM